MTLGVWAGGKVNHACAVASTQADRTEEARRLSLTNTLWAPLALPLRGLSPGSEMRLALELKKPGARPFDALVTELALQLRLDEASFRRFLAQQGEFFTALATGRG